MTTTAPTATPDRRVVENAEYTGMMRRMIRAHGRRVGAGDVAGLGDLLVLQDELEKATQTAVDGLRSNGYSWADIGRELKVSRQAAQQRWGH
jgi:hypothetical protein